MPGGLLPLELSSESGRQVTLESGEVGSVRGSGSDADGRNDVTLRPELPRWMCALMFAACVVPPAGQSDKRQMSRPRGRHVAVA